MLADAGQAIPLTSWPAFVLELTKWVRPVTGSSRKDYTDLFSIQQGKSQTVKDYIVAFNLAHSKVAHDLPAEHSVVTYLFLRGLKPHLRVQVLARKPRSLQDHMHMANVLTDLQNSVPHRLARSSRGTSLGSGSASTSGSSKQLCNHCKEPGHAEARCYTKYPELRPKRKQKFVKC